MYDPDCFVSSHARRTFGVLKSPPLDRSGWRDFYLIPFWYLPLTQN